MALKVTINSTEKEKEKDAKANESIFRTVALVLFFLIILDFDFFREIINWDDGSVEVIGQILVLDGQDDKSDANTH